MSINAVASICQYAKNKIVNIFENQTTIKITNCKILSYIFLTIGIIFSFITLGSFFHIISITSDITTIILGISISSIFVGGIILNKTKKIIYHPKDFGIIGIKNINNDCWLNSLLQILLNNKKLKQLLQIDNNFKIFIKNYDDAIQKNENPNSTHLKEYLSHLCQTITIGNEFQDLHEPLTHILNLLTNDNSSLQNTLTTIRHSSSNDGLRQYTSEIKETHNGIINLPLSNMNKFTLSNLIANYCFSSQENTYYITQNVEKTIQENKFFGLWKRDIIVKEEEVIDVVHTISEERKLAFPPENLFFNIERYQLNPIVDVPINLRLEKKYFTNNQSANYNLESFACYENCCHYVSYIKKDGIWFLCDDNHVKTVSEKIAKKAAKKAYVLLYTKL